MGSAGFTTEISIRIRNLFRWFPPDVQKFGVWPGGSLTTWNYDPATGRLLYKLDNDSRGAAYTYTDAGRMHTRAWERGVTTTYGYTNGRLNTVDYSDTTPNLAYTFDRLGRTETITQNNQSKLEYTYAADLSIDTETIRYDLNHDGTYDFTRVLDRHNRSLGRDMGWSLKVGNTTENQADYAYNAITGRLTTVADASSSFSYGYVDNSQGLLHTVTGPAHTVTNTFEATRDALLTKGNSRNSNASDIASIGYTVNAIGQRTNATRSGAATNSTDWAYDNLGQLVQADDSVNTSDRVYQYDSIGNREKTAVGTLELPGNPNYAANALNQYTTIPQATATPVYDFDGNMTTGPLPVSPTTNSTLVWDGENRLVEIKNGATTLAAYSYDALARRISATVGEATILYLYDGFNRIAEYSGTTLAKTYLWGMDLSGSMQGAGGVGGLLAENHHAGSTTSTFYPCFDGNGNVTEYLYPDGSTAAHFEYDPFGNTTVNTDSGNLFAYRFSTKPLDFETGLYYYTYRYYDPLTGRWPLRDPIGERGGVNLYAFVGNDGVNKCDPLGMVTYDYNNNCKTKDDLGHYSDLHYTMEMKFIVGDVTLKDPESKIVGYLTKYIPKKASKAIPQLKEYLGPIYTASKASKVSLAAMGILYDAITNQATVTEVSINLKVSVCACNDSDEIGLVDAYGDNSREVWKSLLKEPQEVGDAVFNSMIDATETLIDDMNQKTK